MTKRDGMTKAQAEFLHKLLRWEGAATPRELGPQTTQEQNSARQRCKRNGLVEFDKYYWRITAVGRAALANAEKQS